MTPLVLSGGLLATFALIAVGGASDAALLLLSAGVD
jgi:hypothetical protein